MPVLLVCLLLSLFCKAFWL